MLSKLQSDTLLLLSKRKRKNRLYLNYYSHSWCAYKNINSKVGICFICDKEFIMSTEDWCEHGLQHLKESNLLPFM
jgi:hypothetical protein